MAATGIDTGVYGHDNGRQGARSMDSAPPSSRRRPVLPVGAGIALCLVLGALFWAMHAAPASLMAGAVRVPGYADATGNAYRLAGSPMPGEVCVPDMSAPFGGQLLAVDTHTGQTRKIRFVPKQAGLFAAPGLHVSSDVGWAVAPPSPGHPTATVLDASGRSSATASERSANYVCSSDDSTWAAFGSNEIRVWRMSGGLAAQFPMKTAPGSNPPLWFDGRRGILVWGARRVPGQGPYRLDAVMLGKPVVTGSIEVALPPGADVEEARLSPDGSRVLWYLGLAKGQGSEFANYLFGRLLGRGFSDQPYSVEGIWVSRPDGSGLHALGTVPAEFYPEGMASACWCDNGRSVAFTYRHGIYVRPAE